MNTEIKGGGKRIKTSLKQVQNISFLLLLLQTGFGFVLGGGGGVFLILFLSHT